MFSRAYTADLEVRSGSDGRTVHGIAVPFDTPTVVDDGWGSYEETFRMGAFRKTIREQRQPDGSSKVKFLANHDRIGRLPLGRAQLLREDTAGLYGEFRVSKTPDGDAALELVRDGVLDAFSVGFVPVKDREPEPGKIERLEVKLPEVSAVAFPAYAGALIAGVRHAGTPSPITREQLEQLLEMFERGLDLDQILRQLSTPETPDPGTPDEGAADPDTPDVEPSTPPDEVAEPPADPEAADGTSSQPRHSLPNYSPAQRPVMSRESRRSRIGRVRALLAQAEGAE